MCGTIVVLLHQNRTFLPFLLHCGLCVVALKRATVCIANKTELLQYFFVRGEAQEQPTRAINSFISEWLFMSIPLIRVGQLSDSEYINTVRITFLYCARSDFDFDLIAKLPTASKVNGWL